MQDKLGLKEKCFARSLAVYNHAAELGASKPTESKGTMAVRPGQTLNIQCSLLAKKAKGSAGKVLVSLLSPPLPPSCKARPHQEFREAAFLKAMGSRSSVLSGKPVFKGAWPHSGTADSIPCSEPR